ncbi:MAG: hypothetical protein IJ429_01240 [Lachnospiraceae bacterium]|nr:hypothetical protein [Lachnospiraceae bacterium]
MNYFKEIVKKEIFRLEKMLVKIDSFLEKAPEGCLKWQNKRGTTYYFHQFMRNEMKEEEKKEEQGKDLQPQNGCKNTKKWIRKYIKKKDIDLAKCLAQKQYYITVRPIIEKNLYELNRLVRKYQENKIEEIYDQLSLERKRLVVPLETSIKEKVRQWKEEKYEINQMYSENLRYETEQGELVRSKSELIIANTLYRYRSDVLYRYEQPLKVAVDGKIKTYYPDFTVLNVHTGKVTYWEHVGRMDDPYYASEFVRKINAYMLNGIMPGKEVILTFETQTNVLDLAVVRKWIKKLIL